MNMMMPAALPIRRLPNSNGAHEDSLNGNAIPHPPALNDRVWVHSSGGTGLRVATHHKALGVLERSSALYCHLDSDHGERYSTALPDGRNVSLSAPNELCLIGADDLRAELQKQPHLLPLANRLLRNITVAQTQRRGAAQIRPIGALQYLLSLPRVVSTLNHGLDLFFPRHTVRNADLGWVRDEQRSRLRAEMPLIDVHIAGATGGQGSSTFLMHAYLTRWLMDKRRAQNVVRVGVLLGPRAFRGRGTLHNYVATLRELEHAYRFGFRVALGNGEVIEYAVPPFDLFFLVDLPEWPHGEDTQKLSDTAMDDWLRQVALGTHLLTNRTMHDRLQAMLLNTQNQDIGGLSIATFSSALINSNLNALIEHIAVHKTQETLRELAKRCGD